MPSLRERLKRAWHVFVAYTANQEPDQSHRHDWVIDTEAMEFFDEAERVYSDRLRAAAVREAKEIGSFDKYGNPLINLEVALRAVLTIPVERTPIPQHPVLPS